MRHIQLPEKSTRFDVGLILIKEGSEILDLCSIAGDEGCLLVTWFYFRAESSFLGKYFTY